jgi:hypothetical protein
MVYQRLAKVFLICSLARSCPGPCFEPQGTVAKAAGPNLNQAASCEFKGGLNYLHHIKFMKVIGAISIVAISLYFVDQNNYGGYYASHLFQMIRAIGASFGFH